MQRSFNCEVDLTEAGGGHERERVDRDPLPLAYFSA